MFGDLHRFLASESRLTIHPGIVRFHSDLRHLPILRQECIALAAVVAEDGRAIEGEVEIGGKFSAGVAKKTDLELDLVLTTEVRNKSQ